MWITASDWASAGGTAIVRIKIEKNNVGPIVLVSQNSAELYQIQLTSATLRYCAVR